MERQALGNLEFLAYAYSILGAILSTLNKIEPFKGFTWFSLADIISFAYPSDIDPQATNDVEDPFRYQAIQDLHNNQYDDVFQLLTET